MKYFTPTFLLFIEKSMKKEVRYMNKQKLSNAAGRVRTYATVWMITFVALSVVYTTASLVGYLKGVQVVVRETQYIKEVSASAVSPLAE